MELVVIGAVLYLASEKIFNIPKVPSRIFKKHQVDEYRNDIADFGYGYYPDTNPTLIPYHYGNEEIRQYPIREFQPVYFEDNAYLYGAEPAYQDPSYEENMRVFNSTRKQ